jgi:prepilin-type processing-associated H-X9-DG protein
MTKLLGYFHGGACVVGFCDGSVRSFSKSLARKSLNAYITKNGGEVVSDDE